MGFLKAISDLIESIFKKSSPEVQQRHQMKRLESDLAALKPAIFKNGNLTPNFGEAIFSLYRTTHPLNNLFAQTISPNDIPRQHRFEAQLIITGYSEEDQNLIDSLSYEIRKSEIIAAADNPDRIYEKQRKKLEKIVMDLNTDGFKRMDADLLELRQLSDFCTFNFVTFLQLFDSNFIPADSTYTPSFSEVPVTKAVNLLEDLYYQLAGLKITVSTANAVVALAELTKGHGISDSEKASLISDLKKINYVLNHIISAQKLKMLVQAGHANVSYEPKTAQYSGSPRQEFADMIQDKFKADEQRMRTEIQEEEISRELVSLFDKTPLDEVDSYNAQNSEKLQNSTPLSFKWVFPMRILKTFTRIYLSDPVKSLLNDIVIEGFFNNPTYKSEFSTMVYAAINAASDIKNFEDSFLQDNPNSINILLGYIQDSRKNADFYKKLENMVLSINNDAHKVIQTLVSSLFSLYNELGELIADARKPSSEIISNLKVLMMSSRNKDNTNLLEQQYPGWKIFFDIMKNYAIIGNGDIQS